MMVFAPKHDSKKENAKARILVVDDEPNYRKLLSWELGAKGYEVVVARNSQEGLSRTDQENFELIITDVRMPGGMDGIDFTTTCRDKNPLQKVIMITGYAMEEKLTSLLENEDILCLRKPFDIRELFDSIQNLLQTRRS